MMPEYHHFSCMYQGLGSGPIPETLLFHGSITCNELMITYLQVAQNWWLSQWSNATAAAVSGHLSNDMSHYYLHIYFYLGLAALGFSWLRTYTLLEGSVSATRQLHARLLTRVRRTPGFCNRFHELCALVDSSNVRHSRSCIICTILVLGLINMHQKMQDSDESTQGLGIGVLKFAPQICSLAV